MPVLDAAGGWGAAAAQGLLFATAVLLLGREVIGAPDRPPRHALAFLAFTLLSLAGGILLLADAGPNRVGACIALANACIWAGAQWMRQPRLAAGTLAALPLAGLVLLLPPALGPLAPWIAALPLLPAARAFRRLDGPLAQGLPIAMLLAGLCQGLLPAIPAVALLAPAVLAVALALAAAAAPSDPLARLGLSMRREALDLLHAGLPAVIFVRTVAPDGSSRALYKGGDIHRVTGRTPEELARAGGLEALAAANESPFRISLLRVLQEGEATFDWHIAGSDGTLAWMRAHLRRLSGTPDEGGTVVGFVLNVTAERAAHARASASARLATLGEVAAGLAHELRQPLATIMLAAETAQLDLLKGDTASANSRLEPVVSQAERAGELIEHLRRFARGDTPAGALQAVSLARVIQGALSLTSPQLRAARISLDCELGETAPVVLGQLIPLEQVVVNLLTNARDALATLATGRERRIRIEAGPDPADPAAALLVVTDTGPGIAAEILPRLFLGPVTTKDPEHGTGLGLTICQDLVRQMGGSIAVANGEVGAVFTLRLRAAPPAEAAPTLDPNTLLAEFERP